MLFVGVVLCTLGTFRICRSYKLWSTCIVLAKPVTFNDRALLENYYYFKAPISRASDLVQA